jgi:hypothetical protein
VRKVLKDVLFRNFIPITFKHLLAEKCREALDEGYNIFSDGINGMYSMCVEHLGMQIEPLEDFLFNVDDI